MQKAIVAVVDSGESSPVSVQPSSPVNIGFQVRVSSGVTYTVQHTFNGTDWFDHPEASLVGASDAQDGNYAYPIAGIRVKHVSGSGIAVLTVLGNGAYAVDSTVAGYTAAADGNWVSDDEVWTLGEQSLAEDASSSSISVTIQKYRITKPSEIQVAAIGGSFMGLGEEEIDATLQFPLFRNPVGGSTSTIVFTPSIRKLLEVN